jgi:hypothetical protein
MDKLHFKGDHRKFNPNKLVGPDMFGCWYRPVSAHKDFGDVTTIFYRPVPYADLRKDMQQYTDRVVATRKDPKQWLDETVQALCQDPKWSTLLQRFLTLLQSGDRPPKVERDDSPRTRSQRESRKRLRKKGLWLPGNEDD